MRRPWFVRIFDPAPSPTLDRGAQLRMVRDSPPVVPAPSPYADLAAWRILAEELEEDVAKLSDSLIDALAEKRMAQAATMEECFAHGTTMGQLRRASGHLEQAREDLDVMREERDDARVAETMCSVSRCPRCQTDVGCLPVGWWCDECTRAYGADALMFGYRSITDRINGLTGGTDPADTAKVGDDLGMRWVADHASTTCGSGNGFVVCTRGIHHDGQHVGTSGGQVLAVWPNADDRRPCAKCTDRVRTLSARDWCEHCEGQDADELIEKARALGDEVGQRIVTGAEITALPIGTVLLRQGPIDTTDLGRLHAIVLVTGGWWAANDQHAGPIDQSLSYAVLYVPGDVDEVRPAAGQRDRTPAIEGAALTLRAHDWRGDDETGQCKCGWPHRDDKPQTTTWFVHVAEQLAAVGALGGSVTSPRPVNPDAVAVVLAETNTGKPWEDVGPGATLIYKRMAAEVERRCGPLLTEKAGA